MSKDGYIMEGLEEAIRLDLKTDPKKVEEQVVWAGIKPGMRVGDFGCGAGITSSVLSRLVNPKGYVVAIDFSPQRIEYAMSHYASPGISYVLGDIRDSLDEYGKFDMIWIRFVLEHYSKTSFEIVKHVTSALNPGGIIFLGDLDYNSLTHYQLSDRFSAVLSKIAVCLEEKANLDPYVGRKLYSYLYDLGFTDIEVSLSAHHLFYGKMNDGDIFNWMKKMEIGAKKIGVDFSEFYQDGYEGFYAEFESFFFNPRRFTYTPIICVRGVKP